MYQIGHSGKTECFVSVLREGLTRELLVKHNCLHLSSLFTFQSCVGHMYHFARCLVVSYSRKLFSLQFAWVFTHSLSLSLSLSLTTLTIKSHNKYRVQKIEHNYNQIWHEIKANKTYSCKLQIYILKQSPAAYLDFSVFFFFFLKQKLTVELSDECRLGGFGEIGVF